MILVDVQDTGSVYVCITVKGSRVCEHCNVIAVSMYVLVWYKATVVRDSRLPA